MVIRGGGDLASGTALRLWRCGFPVVLLETEAPVSVRRSVSLSEAVYDGTAQVEELQGVRARTPAHAVEIAQTGTAAVFVDESAACIPDIQPYAVVDAILAKENLGTNMEMASLVIGLGPGFVAGADVHAVVETNRGPNLGRVIWSGAAEPNSGTPNLVAGHDRDRVLRAPADGQLRPLLDIGAIVDKGEIIATVGDRQIIAPFPGLLRGIARPGLQVRLGMKVGDVDPRLSVDLCHRVSDKALAVAGGALEAILIQIRRDAE